MAYPTNLSVWAEYATRRDQGTHNAEAAIDAVARSLDIDEATVRRMISTHVYTHPKLPALTAWWCRYHDVPLENDGRCPAYHPERERGADVDGTALRFRQSGEVMGRILSVEDTSGGIVMTWEPTDAGRAWLEGIRDGTYGDPVIDAALQYARARRAEPNPDIVSAPPYVHDDFERTTAEGWGEKATYSASGVNVVPEDAPACECGHPVQGHNRDGCQWTTFRMSDGDSGGEPCACLRPFGVVVTAEEWKQRIADGLAAEQSDDVDHPAHYGGADDPFEPIKIIEAKGLGFHDGNALKYLLRAGYKPGESRAKDLRKAAWYLTRLARQLDQLEDDDGTV